MRPMPDPWARRDIDGWSADDIWENALLDPLPAGLEADALAGPLAACR